MVDTFCYTYQKQWPAKMPVVLLAVMYQNVQTKIGTIDFGALLG
jgi:hypothetical protein